MTSHNTCPTSVTKSGTFCPREVSAGRSWHHISGSEVCDGHLLGRQGRMASVVRTKVDGISLQNVWCKLGKGCELMFGEELVLNILQNWFSNQTFRGKHSSSVGPPPLRRRALIASWDQLGFPPIIWIVRWLLYKEIAKSHRIP